MKENLHNIIINHEMFLIDTIKAIKDSFRQCEERFIIEATNRDLQDKSGSCAIMLIIIEKTLYTVNLGDSRAILSMNKGKNIIQLSQDHKPNNMEENKRIILNGGIIYQ